MTGYRPLYFYSRFRTAEETVQRPRPAAFFKPDSVRVLSLLREKSSERSRPKTAAVYPNSSVER
ncbi:MAG: hypothetical protein DBY36_04645 [Clostridiales bacterium]|nr:MAG: hypothetical protein DBY36_04645 [Clostridiales bacterium]